MLCPLAKTKHLGHRAQTAVCAKGDEHVHQRAFMQACCQEAGRDHGQGWGPEPTCLK